MAAKIRLVFGPDSQLDPEFFTTDSAIQGLVGLLVFGNNQDAAKEYFEQNECTISVSFFAQGQESVDGTPIPVQLYHNLFINVDNVPSNEYFVVVASPTALEYYDHTSTQDPEDELPANLVKIESAFTDQVMAVYKCISEPKIAVGTIGLLDDVGTIEPAIVGTFLNGALELEAAAERQHEQASDYQQQLEPQALEMMANYHEQA